MPLLSIALVATGLLLRPWARTGTNYFSIKAKWGAWGMVLSGLVLGARAIW